MGIAPLMQDVFCKDTQKEDKHWCKDGCGLQQSNSKEAASDNMAASLSMTANQHSGSALSVLVLRPIHPLCCALLWQASLYFTMLLMRECVHVRGVCVCMPGIYHVSLSTAACRLSRSCNTCRCCWQLLAAYTQGEEDGEEESTAAVAGGAALLPM